MKTIKVWAITANSDQNEGRGITYDVAYFSQKEIAEKIAGSVVFYNSYGIQSTNSGIQVKEKEIIIYENIADYLGNLQNEEINEALKKLTDKEKKLLGLH